MIILDLLNGPHSKHPQMHLHRLSSRLAAIVSIFINLPLGTNHVAMKSLLNRLIRLDYLIHLKSTGNPHDCAQKIGISERSLYDYLKLLKEMGAPVKFSRHQGTYYYNEEGRFRISFLSDNQHQTIEEMMGLAD